MPKCLDCEVWLIVNEDGEYAVGRDVDTAAEAYGETIGGDAGSTGIRRVKVTVQVPLPEVIEATAAIEDEQAVATATAAI